MAEYTSRFIQLTDYVLLEYRYTSMLDPDSRDDIFVKIVNVPFQENQIINVDTSVETTGNVREYSCMQTAPGVYTYLDKDQVPDYLDYSGTPTTTLSSLTCTNIPYDELRFHLVSGYDFGDQDGIMFKVAAMERSTRETVFCNIAFSKTSDNFEYSTEDVYLNGRLYNRYVRVRIPSVKQIQDTFNSLQGHPSQALCLAAQITSDGKGFMPGQPIRITATEIRSSLLS